MQLNQNHQQLPKQQKNNLKNNNQNHQHLQNHQKNNRKY